MNGKIILVACLFGATIYTTEIGGYKDSEGGYNNTCKISQIDKNEIISLLKELQLQVQQTCTARCEPSCNQIETQTEIQTDPQTEIPTETPAQTPTRTSTQTQTLTTKRRPSTTANPRLILSDIDEVFTEKTQSYYQIETQTQNQTLESTTAKSQVSDPDDVCVGE